MTEEHDKLSESVATHTAELTGIKGELNQVWITLKEIQSSLNRSGKTDWMVILTGLMVIGALYGAAIHPLDSNVQRVEATQKDDASKLATAVLEQNKTIQEAFTVSIRHENQINNLMESVKRIEDKGSESANIRITLIEWRLDHPCATPVK